MEGRSDVKGGDGSVPSQSHEGGREVRTELVGRTATDFATALFRMRAAKLGRVAMKTIKPEPLPSSGR